MTGKTQADRDDDTMNDDERRHEDVDTQHDQQGFRNNYCGIIVQGHLLTIYCILYGHLFKPHNNWMGLHAEIAFYWH